MVCVYTWLGVRVCACKCVLSSVFMHFWCSLCVFVCSYMSVLNACQGIYLVSAFRHVCLFSFSHLCVCMCVYMCFPISWSGKYFLIPLWEKKKDEYIPFPIG